MEHTKESENPKKHGMGQIIEGYQLKKDDRVVMVDDVVTSGDSLLKACEAVQGVGAKVAGALSIVDRGAVAHEKFKERGLYFRSVFDIGELLCLEVG